MARHWVDALGSRGWQRVPTSAYSASPPNPLPPRRLSRQSLVP